MSDASDESSSTEQDHAFKEDLEVPTSTTPNPPKLDIPSLPNFLTQVLYTIQTLRTLQGHGATIEQICKFMRHYYKAMGDVESRVRTAILQAKTDGFCTERQNRYMLLVPMSCIQQTQSAQTRRAHLRDMQKIFLFKANMKKSKPEIKKTKDFAGGTDSFSHIRVLSKPEIMRALRDIIYTLKDRMQDDAGGEDNFLSRDSLKSWLRVKENNSGQEGVSPPKKSRRTDRKRRKHCKHKKHERRRREEGKISTLWNRKAFVKRLR